MMKTLNFFKQLSVLVILALVFGCTKRNEPTMAESSTATAGSKQRAASGGQWYKGNVHTHSKTGYDGDTDALTIARWYRDHDYDFLVLSEHNRLNLYTDIQATLDAENAATGHKRLLIIPGEEVTDKLGSKNLHLGAINISAVVPPQGGTSNSDVIRRNFNAIKANGGIPILNHPNLGVGIPVNDVDAVENIRFMEIVNGNPDANGSGLPPMGDYWDSLLGLPHLMYGIAADDAHHFASYGAAYSNPGKGWIHVNAPALTIANIVAAMNAGSFYASTGVTYSDVTVVNNVMSMSLTGAGPFTTSFIGKNGVILKTDNSLNPSYTLPDAGQLYVRAKTNGPNGSAWTQPLFDKSYLVDDAGSGFSASANWIKGTAGSDKYKTSYRYRSTMNGSPDRATFTVGTAGTGDFDIYAWWSVGTAGNRTPEAHYFLPDGREVIVDQRINGGKWNYLGTVRFNAEGNHQVQLAAGGPAGYAVIADAIMMYGPK